MTQPLRTDVALESLHRPRVEKTSELHLRDDNALAVSPPPENYSDNLFKCLRVDLFIVDIIRIATAMLREHLLRVEFTHSRFWIHSLGACDSLPSDFADCDIVEPFGDRAVSVRTNIYGSLSLRVSIGAESLDPASLAMSLQSEGWDKCVTLPFEVPDGVLNVSDLGIYGYLETVDLGVGGRGTLVIAVRGRSEKDRDKSPLEPREEYIVRFVPARGSF